MLSLYLLWMVVFYSMCLDASAAHSAMQPFHISFDIYWRRKHLLLKMFYVASYKLLCVVLSLAIISCLFSFASHSRLQHFYFWNSILVALKNIMKLSSFLYLPWLLHESSMNLIIERRMCFLDAYFLVRWMQLFLLHRSFNEGTMVQWIFIETGKITDMVLVKKATNSGLV